MLLFIAEGGPENAASGLQMKKKMKTGILKFHDSTCGIPVLAFGRLVCSIKFQDNFTRNAPFIFGLMSLSHLCNRKCLVDGYFQLPSLGEPTNLIQTFGIGPHESP